MKRADRASAPIVLDTITSIPVGAAGRATLAASHGGLYAAACALQARLSAVILHDAGFGREQAGIGGIRWLDECQMPGAAISHRSARIGDGADCFRRGVLSFVNEAASRLGARPGQDAAEALALLEAAVLAAPTACLDVRESRRDAPGLPGVVLADSNASVTAADAAAIFVTGSHGGILGGRAATAIRSNVFAAFYNDADRGIDAAGCSRLPALQARGIAGLAVSAWSARIGDAASTLDDGYVSEFNERARDCGAEPGVSAREMVARLMEARRRPAP